MAVIMLFVGRMFLTLFIVRMPGVFCNGRSESAYEGDASTFQSLDNVAFQDLGKVELHSNAACRGGVCFNDARQREELIRHGACAALVVDTVYGPNTMGKPGRNLGPSSNCQLADAAERNDARFIVDAEQRLRGRAFLRYMSVLDAGATFERSDQTSDTGVIGVVNFR
ncbi:hypothetical protein MBENS4_4470 [Novosphingobium sp. MBES04]|nr:hypothetical protein MBENS4_4470 [Novosphingobium sp. MBES04]